MKINRDKAPMAEGDMTPMIDMTFQLIAFFMVLINFTETESDQRITLPSSQLAKPPEGPLEWPITLQLAKDGNVLYNGDVVAIESMRPQLLTEKRVLQAENLTTADATIIIRADESVLGGHVQELILQCQDAGFETFALRVKEDTRGP